MEVLIKSWATYLSAGSVYLRMAPQWSFFYPHDTAPKLFVPANVVQP